MGPVCSVRCCHHLFDPCQNSYFFLAGNPKHNLKVKKSTPIGLPGHDLYQLFEQKCQIATKIWWFFVFLPLLQKLFSFSQMWLDFYGYRSCAILWTMAIIWSAKNPFLSIFWVIYVEKNHENYSKIEKITTKSSRTYLARRVHRVLVISSKNIGY